MSRSHAPLWAGLVAMALVCAEAAAELPARVEQDGFQLDQVGEGRLTWLGFGIYEASLWTPDGRFSDFRDDQPVALALWYERKFSRQQLIDITSGEWERLELAPAAVRAAWSRELERIWRDVDKGDNLTAVVVPGRETLFYDEQGLLGHLRDPDFGPAFLRIWLDTRTAIQDLRVQLLGEQGNTRNP
jgi:hypothetical protein